MLEIGSVIDGKYKILSKVGQGGMSVVYLAINEKANKSWAVKEVRKDGIKDFEVVRQGLVAETDILKKLSHPNLPSIIDVIDTEDSFIIIMDYIEGNSLNKALDEYGAQPQDMVIEWAKQLCDVLGYLHSRTPPIIYRDMKPANVMLKPDGNVTLIDFGTAREFKEKNLADTTCLGTVGYAAPEQFGGMGQTDARTDIYCLGATLYHLVTGMNPCEPPYEIRPIRQINPALSGGLERIILKCTQRDPNDRYQSAAELMYALEHYEEIDDVHRKRQKKKLGWFITAAALTVVFAGVSVWGYMMAENTKKANYDYKLLGADSIDAYKDAIKIDPTRTEAYLGSDTNRGLVDFMISDDVIDNTEHVALNEIRTGIRETDASGNDSTVYVMEELAKADPEGYMDVCNEIGEAYLFYFDPGRDRDKYEAAAVWLRNAAEKYESAGIYCRISDELQDIAKYQNAEQYSKVIETYQKLWDEICTLVADSEEYDPDLQLRVWREITRMINNGSNADMFCSSQVAGKEAVLSLLDDIAQQSRSIADNAMLKDKISELQQFVEDTSKKVGSIQVDKEDAES